MPRTNIVRAPKSSGQFVERRKNPFQHVDSEALSTHVEATVRTLFEKSLHKGVQKALADAGLIAPAATNDANLVARQPAPAAVATTSSVPLKFKAGPKKAQRDENAVVVQNGVRCPDYGTIAGTLWLLFAAAGAGVTLSEARQLAASRGYNAGTAAVALYNWRKFHGVANPSA